MPKFLRLFRSKWVRLPLIAWGVYLVLAASYLGVHRHSTRKEGEAELQTVVARLDAEEPGWRWVDLEAARAPVTRSENSALVAVDLQSVIPRSNQFYPRRGNEDGLNLSEFPPNRLLDDEAYQLVEVALQGSEAAPPLVRKLAMLPSGRRSLVPATDLLNSKWDIDVREYYITEYLDFAFERAARRPSSDRSIEFVFAWLNLARVHGDESLMLSQFSRMARARTAVAKMERALALGAESEELARVQAEFDRESNVDWYRVGIRGQRAFAHEACRGIEDRRVQFHDILMIPATCGNRPPRSWEIFEAWKLRPTLPEDHANCLDLLTRYLKLADLPEEKQFPALGSLPSYSGDRNHKLTSSLLARVPTFHNICLFTRATLRCAVAAIAAERFRLLTNTWPRSLDEIPKSILSKVPLDPFTGKPLIFAMRPDGVTVYSVGFDGKDDGGIIDHYCRPEQAGTDIGFRLYNPDQRRLPPLPVKAASIYPSGSRLGFWSPAPHRWRRRMILPLRLFRSKWVRLPLIVWGVYIVVAAAILFSSRYRTRQQGEKEVAAVVAKLDAEEPGWKWQEIDAARGPLPDARSTTELPVRFRASLTGADREELDSYSKFIGQLEPINRRLTEFKDDEIDDFLTANKSLQIAEEFQSGPAALPRPELSRDLIFTRIPNTVDLPRAVIILGLDAERCCRNGDGNTAVVRLRSMLNAERSIGSEPFAASQTIRMVSAGRIAWQTERILAQSNPTAGLAELQAELLDEARVDFALTIFRADRAVLHELFLRLESGTVEFEPLCRRLSTGRYGSGYRREDAQTYVLFYNLWWLYKKYLPHNHAEALESLTRACAICARPESEHPKALAELQAADMQPARENFFAPGLLASPESILTRQMKARARLRCAATAIAVERYRLKFGGWPENLEEIPKDILAAVPLDPFDGKPLKYSRTQEGVEVFSIESNVATASDRRDSGYGAKSQPDFLCRLIEPHRRGLPPPPVPFEDFPEFEFGPPGLVFGKGTRVEDDAIEPGPEPRIVAGAK